MPPLDGPPPLTPPVSPRVPLGVGPAGAVVEASRETSATEERLSTSRPKRSPMPEIKVSIPDDLHEEVKAHPEIDREEVARQSFSGHAA